MSTAEMQAYLARLYTDSSFRRLFHHDPDETLDDYDLRPPEREAIQGIDRHQLEFFAASLLNKRRKRWQRAFPALFTLDGPALKRYCARYHDVFPLRPGALATDEILQFGTFMAETLRRPGDMPAYAGELVRFERLVQQARLGHDTVPGPPPARPRIEAGDRPARAGGVTVETFDYNVTEIEQALTGGAEPVVRAEPQIVLCATGTARREPRILAAGAPTAYLLDLCDGDLTLREIIARAEEHFGQPGLAGSVTAAVDQLTTWGVLEVAGHDGALPPS